MATHQLPAPPETVSGVVQPYRAGAVTAQDFMPVFTVEQAVTLKGQINQFIDGVFRDGEDYGAMPGSKQANGTERKILLKPGAEKLCSIFGMGPTYTEDKIIEDWTGEHHGGEPLFYYSYKCRLYRNDLFMGESIGSCNSWETKYRYRWVAADQAKHRADYDKLPKRGGKRTIFEPNFALEKRETSGKYGKPAEYWAAFDLAANAGTAKRTKKKLGPKEHEGFEITVDEVQVRIPNPDYADIVNTCQKMAQKRALVAAVLVVTNCSDAFTQDVEDFTSADSGPVHATPFDDDFQPPAEAKPAAATSKPSAEPKKQEPLTFDARPVRDLPPGLAQWWGRIEQDKTLLKKAFTSYNERLVEAAGEEGDTFYQATRAKIRARFPEGSIIPMAEIRETLIDLELESVRLEDRQRKANEAAADAAGVS
jgi:hypothetical protein